MADKNATDSANIGSGSTDIGSGTKPVPPPPKPPPPKPPPPPDDDGVDDALNQTDGAVNTGGVWGRPRR